MDEGAYDRVIVRFRNSLIPQLRHSREPGCSYSSRSKLIIALSGMTVDTQAV